jgi:tRNA(Ile2) C34 agmatinyltransferase TiaS
MSKKEKSVKLSVNYERNVPRCGNCSHLKVFTKANGDILFKCNKIKYEVKRFSCCDLWLSKIGEHFEGD